MSNIVMTNKSIFSKRGKLVPRWMPADLLGIGAAGLLILGAMGQPAAVAEDFVPSCERIGPTTVALVNNEFSPLGKFATWGVSHTLPLSGCGGGTSIWSVDWWITGMTDTGHFDPADGMLYEINTDMPWGTFAYWGRDVAGSAVYSSDAEFNIHRLRVDEETGAITRDVLAGPLDRRPQYIYPSRIENSPSTYLAYYKGLKIQGEPFFGIFWIDSANPTVENRLFHNGKPQVIPQRANSNARWVPEQPVFVYPFIDAAGVVQVGAYNVVDGSSLVLTTDAGNKADPFPFVAPEYPGDWLFAAVVGTDRIAIYRVTGGTDTSLLKIIDIPSDLPYEQSGETFVWEGKTYIAAGVNDAPPGSRVSPGSGPVASELWIADIDPFSTFARKVNTEGVSWTLDPEILVSPTGVWMYGYQKPPGFTQHELQKCRTGFGN